jgi:hypothetical protein
MAITSYDQLLSAAKQRFNVVKTATRTSIALIHFSVFDLAGDPGAGVLAGGQTSPSTAAGIVPTDATPGYPLINAFGGSNSGYLSLIRSSSSVISNLWLYDRLFCAGAYSFNSNVTLASQPSYSSRVPGGTDFTNTEIWIEVVTAFTGNLTVTITYTNQDGTTGRSTGSFAPALAPTVGRCFLIPLQAGDTGVQKIESVVSSVATVGTFNVNVLRPLWSNRVVTANGLNLDDVLKTDAIQVFADSALYLMVQADSTSTGLPNLNVSISNA